MKLEELDYTPPVCPRCKSNKDVRKNGTTMNRGQVYQYWRCKNCEMGFY